MRRFGFYSNFQGADEIKDLTISIDICIQKHEVVTTTQYYISMVCLFIILIRPQFILEVAVHMRSMKEPSSKTQKHVFFNKICSQKYRKIHIKHLRQSLFVFPLLNTSGKLLLKTAQNLQKETLFESPFDTVSC